MRIRCSSVFLNITHRSHIYVPAAVAAVAASPATHPPTRWMHSQSSAASSSSEIQYKSTNSSFGMQRDSEKAIWRSRNDASSAPHGQLPPSRGLNATLDEEEAVDAWRSCNKDPTNLQSSANPQYDPNAAFNPYAQVFTPVNLPNPHQAQLHLHPMLYQQPGFLANAPKPYPRSQNTPYQPPRFSSDVQEKQKLQNSTQPRSTHGQQRSAIHQVAYRPRASGGRIPAQSRNYSNDQPVQSIEQDQTISAGLPTSYEGFRRRYGRQSTPRRTGTASPPPAPRATEDYIGRARLPPSSGDIPQRLLVILDLNGTLIVKPDRRNPGNFVVRPGVPQLLDYLFKNHIVMIYTSSQPRNAKIVVHSLFTEDQRSKLAGVWARDMLDLNTDQYYDKVQVYKKLDKIWKDKDIQASCPEGRWEQRNTVLVDDSHLKALAQPHNLLQVPEFTNKRPKQKAAELHNKQQEAILQSLIAKLEKLKWQNDVSTLIRRWQTGEAEIPKVPGSGVVVDEKVDQKELAQTKAVREVADQKERQLAKTKSLEPSGDAGRTESSRSPSPITEDVWKNILDGKDRQDPIPTPTSQSR